MRRLAIAAVLAALLVVGAVGYALGSIPSADGRIHGCYASNITDHKSFLLLDDDQADGQCPPGWTEISWAAD